MKENIHKLKTGSYCRAPFFEDRNFRGFQKFSVLHKFVQNIVRIHFDMEVLHEFIVIYQINMAILKYLK